jgi:excisionase family DNA binding protein
MSRAVPHPSDEPTLTVARFAEITGVGVRTVYDLVERGEIPAIRLGTRRGIRILTAKALAQYGLEPTAPRTDQEPVPAA